MIIKTSFNASYEFCIHIEFRKAGEFKILDIDVLSASICMTEQTSSSNGGRRLVYSVLLTSKIAEGRLCRSAAPKYNAFNGTQIERERRSQAELEAASY